MEIPNRDMFPSDATRARFSKIAPLLDNPLFDDAFRRHEAKAVRAKRLYHRVGRFAVFLIAISAVYTMAETLVLQPSRWTPTLTLTFALFAIIGISLQSFIILTRQKETWLLNRFACERLRSLKFQSFHLGDEAQDQTALTKAVKEFSQKHLSRLDNDLNTGMAMLERFNATKALDTPTHQDCADADPDIAAQAREAFEELRFHYQVNFASSEVARLKGKLRSVASLQDFMYFSAIGLAILSLGIKIFDPEHLLPTNVIDFLAITLFVAGATKTIVDNALLQEQSQGRYETYIASLEHAFMKAKGDAVSLDALVDGIERVSLVELEHFCQDVLHVSYRF